MSFDVNWVTVASLTMNAIQVSQGGPPLGKLLERRQKRLEAIRNNVREQLALQDEAILDLLLQDERVEEIVTRALQAAWASSSEEHRRILASLVVTALTGPAESIDDLGLIGRIIEDLHPADIRALAVVNRPHPLRQGGTPENLYSFTTDDFSRRIASSLEGTELALLRRLEVNGCVRRETLGGGKERWWMTPLGHRLLEIATDPAVPISASSPTEQQ